MQLCSKSAVLTLLLILNVTCFGQRGAHTLARGMDQLASEAEVIVRGSVASARIEPHPELTNLKTVVVTIRVNETWKGAPTKTLQFRQFIWDIRDEVDSARYRKGEAVLLFLGPTSKYGLRSPVGLEQGRFLVVRRKDGQLAVLNGRHNIGLFDGTDQRTKEKGLELSVRSRSLMQRPRGEAVPLDDLKAFVKEVTRSKR
jgi:hypothetical protein